MQRYTILVCTLIVMLLASACNSNVDTSPETESTAPGEAAATTNTNASSSDSNAADDDTPVTITFGLLEFQRQTYEPLAETFNEEHDNITVQLVSLDDIFGLGSGHSPNIEEMTSQIVRTADTAVSLFEPRTEDIENGYLYDLKPLMDADPNFDRDDFYANALDEHAETGGIYQIPHTLPVPLLSYNKDLWMASGLPDPDPDWEWSDMIGAAEQMAQKSGDTIEVYGLIEGSSGILPLLYEMNQAGLDIFSTPIDELQLNTPEMATALETVKTMADNGVIYVPVSESGVIEFGGMGDVRQFILDQRVGLWMPNLLMSRGSDSEQPDFAVGTVPFPSGSVPSFFIGTPQGYMISSGTQHPQQAWQWLEFLSRQELEQPFQGNRTTLTSIPARKSLAESSGYWDDLDEETAEAVRTALEQPSPSLPAGLRQNFNQIFTIINTAMGKVIGGNTDVDTALQEAQTKLTETVAELELTPEPTPDTSPIVVATPEPEVAAQPDATEVTFSTLWFGADEVRRLAKAFTQEHPDIAVEVKNIESRRTMPEFAEVAATNDCFFWFGEPDQEDLDAVIDLTPLIDADATFPLDDYPSAFLEPYQDGTGLYGLPYAVDLQLLLYNQTAFDAAGLDYPQIEWTTDDFLNAVEQIDQGSGTDRMYGFVSLNPVSDIFFFLDRFGASYTSGSGDTLQPNFTDPTVIEAVQFYLDLLREYSPHEQLQGYRQTAQFNSEPFQLTSQGRVGMWFSTGFFFGAQQDTGFTRAFAPPPMGDSGVTSNDVRVRGFFISADTDVPEACWTWLTYLSTDVSMLQNSFPARLSVADSPEFAEQAQAGSLDVFESYRTALEEPLDEGIARPDRSEFDPYWFLQAIDRALQGEDLERELSAAEETTAHFLECVQAEEASVCAPQVDPDYDGWNMPDEEDAEEE